MFVMSKLGFLRLARAQDVEQREEAHAILRALNKIEVELDAAIMAETLLDRK